MINCIMSVDTHKRTECIALGWKWYIENIRRGKCGTKGCPFYKPREEVKP